MVSVSSHLIEEVNAHARSDSLEDAREICADGTNFPNNICIINFFEEIFLPLYFTDLHVVQFDISPNIKPTKYTKLI